ncbi:MAG: FHA domain-containing protein [Deltaproteobacteria bacterium]|nr:FHA domain-containing protein [Deltaproteobacteria bacterium]
MLVRAPRGHPRPRRGELAERVERDAAALLAADGLPAPVDIVALMPTLADTQSDASCRFFRSLRVGRAPDNDLVLGERTVSSFHACIELRDGGWFLRDLGSSNGTSVNGTRIEGWTQLASGAEIGFGPKARWTVDDLTAQPGTATWVSPWVVQRDDGTEQRLELDRLTFGRGSTWDVSSAGGPPGLHAVLFAEDEGMFLMGIGTADVQIGDSAVDTDAPTPVTPGQAFSVGGASFVLRLDEGTLSGMLATAQTGVPARRYTGLRLSLVDRGDFGDIVVENESGAQRFEDQELRFSLLVVLARELLAQRDRGVTENLGWIDDETLRVGIWGRRAIENQATSTLAKLMHDTRTMLGRKGIDGLFIEKKRGRSRLRLDPDAVRLL